jgi:hypothetical protein
MPRVPILLRLEPHVAVAFKTRARSEGKSGPELLAALLKAALALLLCVSAHAEPFKPTSTALDKPAPLQGIAVAGYATRMTPSGGFVIRHSSASKPVVLRGISAKVGSYIHARALPGLPETVNGVTMPGMDALPR